MIIVENGIERDATDEEMNMIHESEKKQEIINEKQSEIQDLQKELSETDYIMSKAYEYSLVGKTTDYDIEKIHLERQALRDRINSIEEDIKLIKEEMDLC